MGIYHGSKFIAVKSTVATDCFVRAAELKPTGEIGAFGKEPTFLMVEECYLQYPQFDCSKEAEFAVKEHIFSITVNQIVERVVGIELAKLEIEELRWRDRKSASTKTKVEELKADVNRMQQEIKDLKSIRRSPIAIQ